MIQWQDLGTVKRSICDRFELEEEGPNVWRPYDNQFRERGEPTDMHLASEWCESRLVFPEPRFDVVPDIVVEVSNV